MTLWKIINTSYDLGTEITGNNLQAIQIKFDIEGRPRSFIHAHMYKAKRKERDKKKEFSPFSH